MLKLLFAQHTRSSSDSAARYFLDFADEVGADVTAILAGGAPASGPALVNEASWFYNRFLPKVFFRQHIAGQAIASSRIFYYDLVLTNRGRPGNCLGGNPSRYLAQMAWTPVMSIPGEAAFKPIRNILFIDNQDITPQQPILKKLNGFWRQQHFLYPAPGPRSGSYTSRRFDETGYPALPRLDLNHIRAFIRRHDIDLVVASQSGNTADSRILEKLPAPLLAFNSRNLALPAPQSRPSVYGRPAGLLRAGKV